MNFLPRKEVRRRIRMKYSNTFTVDTNGKAIYRGDGGNGNEIPTDVEIHAIAIVPTPSAGTFPDYYVKGTHTDSECVLIPKEAPVHREGSTSNESPLLWVKSSSGSITINLFVEGK